MPLDPYENPDRKPPVGELRWEPDEIPTGDGELLNAWNYMTLVRGKFRNDYFISESSKTVTVTFSEENSSFNNSNIYSPINNAFRKLQSPNRNVPVSASNFIFQNSGFNYTIDLLTANRLSSIAINYAYSIDIYDSNLLSFMEQSDVENKDIDIQKVINFRQNGPQSAIMDVDWSKYSIIKIKVFTSTDTEESASIWPTNNQELKATGYYYANFDSSTEFRNTYIRFSNSLTRDSFKVIKKIKVYNDTKIAIKVSVNKIQLFNWGRANLRPENLPCSALSYAIPINLDVSVMQTLGSVTWPTSDTPFSIKLFCPDDIGSSRGFAHAIYIKFLLAGILDFFSLLSPFPVAYVVFMGPILGKKTSIFYLDPHKISGINGYLVRLNDITLRDWAFKFTVQKTESEENPANDSAWEFLLEHNKNGLETNSLKEVFDLTYHDIDATKNTWYRIIQTSQESGLSETSQPFKGQLYTEKSVLRLNSTGVSFTPKISIIRTASTTENFLNQSPLAIFTIDYEDDFFSKNIFFRKGIVRFQFSGTSYDPGLLYSSHVYLRMWFHPGTESVSFDNPDKYRNQFTELIFKNYESGGAIRSKISIGTPLSLDDLLVSAPLLDNSNTFEIFKFVDGLVDYNNSYAPFPQQNNVKLVVGVYAYSYLNDSTNPNLVQKYNPPNIQVNIDPFESYIEIPIIKNTKDTLSVSRFYDYNNIIIKNLAGFAFNLSNSTFIGTSLAKDGYLEYNKTFEIIDVNTNPNGISYASLLSLRPSGVPQKLVAKIAKYSLNDNNSVYFFVDFVTYFNSFINTKVNQGTISVKIKFDIDLDSTKIRNKIKIAAFFVNRAGLILERIFMSDFSLLPIEVGDYNYNKLININVPFYVSNSDCQIIFRLYYYPYSASGTLISDAEWADILASMNKKPEGLRILDLNIEFSEALFSTAEQVEDVSRGSVNYEDLPLLPAQSLDSQQFWFASKTANNANEFFQIVPYPDGSFKLSGAVYSPTWLVDLPSNMEVSTRFNPGIIQSNGQDTSTANVAFRTAPFDERISGDEKIGAMESPNGKFVHVAKNNTTSPFSGIDASSANTMKHYQSYSPLFTQFNNDNVQNATGVLLRGKNPDLKNINNQTVKDNFGVAILAQNTGDTAFNVLAINSSNGDPKKFTIPNSGKDFNETIITQYASHLTKTSIAQDQITKEIYIVGFCKPGSIILKSLNLNNPGTAFQTNSTGQSLSKVISFNYLVDGLSSPTYDTSQALIKPVNLSQLSALNTFTGIGVDHKSNVLVAYVLEGLNNQINARMLVSNTRVISNRITVVDMGSLSNSALLNVFCPVVEYYNSMYYLVFYCAGKIFLSIFSSLPINYQNFSMALNPVYLIAGNSDFSSNSNQAHPFLKNLLINKRIIIKKQNNDTEVDLKMQAPGFYISRNPANLGKLFIYYKLPTGTMLFREILQDGTIGAANKFAD